MPSSTSSSDPRLWRHTWLIVLALCVTFLGGWEIFWRVQGFSPTVNNDDNLWAVERGRVRRTGPDAVIFVGSSRMQLDIDPDAFSRGSGWSGPHQLAIAMSATLPILVNLAADSSVSGTIICEIYPMTFFDNTYQRYGVAKAHLDRHASFTPADEAEARLRTLTQQTLVSSLPALFPNQIVRAISGSRWPRPNHASFGSDRFGESDSTYMKLTEARALQLRQQWKRWKGNPANPAQITRMTRRVNRLVRQVRERGGDVMFVRLPVDGDTRVREARIMPRRRFWDHFASQVNASAIHYADHPGLAGFSLPDGSHLDRRDIAAFSVSLGEILARERTAWGNLRQHHMAK